MTDDEIIAQYEAELLESQQTYESDKEQRALIKSEVSELLAKVRELEKAEAALNATRMIRLNEMRKKEQRLEDARRAKAIAAENARLAEEAALKAERVKELFKHKKWASRVMPHQMEGANFISTARRAILADSMGLGKTFTGGVLYLDMVGSKRALVICPGDVMSGFVKEMKDWAPDRKVLVIGKKSKADQAFSLDIMRDEPEWVIIMNYETWYKNTKLWQDLADMCADTVIVDEAHKIKELNGMPYRGVQAIIEAQNSCPECGAYKAAGEYLCPVGHGDTWRVPSVKNVLFMTGTPVLNHPADIYPMLHLINHRLFPTLAAFKRDFCRIDYDGKLVWNAGGEARLAQRIGSLYIRRTRESAGIKLPKQEIVYHEIDFDAEAYPLQAEIIRMLNEDAAIQISEDKVSNQMAMLALITRSRQAAIWPGGITLNEPMTDEYGLPMVDEVTFKPLYRKIPVGDRYRESIKLDRAVELYNELVEDGHRVAMFSQFDTVLVEMQNRLGDKVAKFTGSTLPEERTLIKQNFDRAYGEEPKWDGLLLNYKTGGVGLNLTAATAIIILDEEWNPGMNSQAYDRIYRMGQTEETQVHVLRMAKSIDTWLANLIARKADQVGNFDNAVIENSIMDELKRMLGGDYKED